VAPFFVVKSEVVPFFVVKWPPNLIGIATLEGNNGSESDEKLSPNIGIWYMKGYLRILLNYLHLKPQLPPLFLLLHTNPLAFKLMYCNYFLNFQ